MIDKKETSGLLLVKLIDFGVTKIFNRSVRNRTFAGSNIYMEPEVLKADYNDSCDIWSIGVILFIFLIGIPPFHGKDNNEIYRSIKEGKYDTLNAVYISLSENAKDLISKLFI